MATEYLKLHEFLATEVVDVDVINANNEKIDDEASRVASAVSSLPTESKVQELIDEGVQEYSADNVTTSMAENVISLHPDYKAKMDETPLLVKLTQAEYDALATKDANTIYFTKEVI